jgi:hypothetical protein
MKKQTNVLVPAMDSVLAPAGFQRRGASWSRRFDDVVQLVELQRSSFGEQYYLNVGLWLTTLGPVPQRLRERDMHVRLRVDVALPGEMKHRLTDALDLENGLTSEARSAAVTAIASTTVLGWLSDWSSAQGIAAALRSHPLSVAFILRVAQEALRVQ